MSDLQPFPHFQFVGTSSKGKVGVAELLSSGGDFLDVSDNAGTIECPLPGRGMGDVEKPQQDMAFHLIVLSLIIGCERVFDLTAVWVHPCQAHFQNLEETACKLMLLADNSTD